MTEAFENAAGASESSVRSITSPTLKGFAIGAVAPDSPVRSTTSVAFLFPLDGALFAGVESLNEMD